MHKIFYIFLLIPVGLAAQANKSLPTDIQQVRVFASGAQVEREGKTSLNEGTTHLLISGLSPFLDPEAIQVKGKGNFIIMGVQHQLNYLSRQRKQERVDSLQEAIRDLEDALALEAGKLEIIKEKRSLLNENKKLTGANASLSLAQLQQAMTYYDKELTEMKQEELAIARKREQLKEQLEKLKNQLQAINGQRALPTSELQVEVKAARSTQATFSISYFVQNAGWSPVYDVRINDIGDPVQLIYQASVYQNTGEMWEEVNLVLSNANPNRNNVAPEIQTWYLDFYRPRPRQLKRSKMAAPAEAFGQEVMDDAERDEGYAELAAVAPVTEITESTLSIQFAVQEPYTIPANGEQKQVDLQTLEIPAQYRYLAIPKYDPTAYLVAQMTEWDQYNVLPGQASLYFEGAYVGDTYLDTRAVGDTLQLSLGADPSIVLEREKQENFTRKRTLGSNQVVTRGFDITVRNTKSKAIALTLIDQIPRSTTSEIEVNLEQAPGADFDSGTGKLSWRLNLPPGSEKSVSFIYEVKYPKDREVILE